MVYSSGATNENVEEWEVKARYKHFFIYFFYKDPKIKEKSNTD